MKLWLQVDYHTADFTSTLLVEHPYQPNTFIFDFHTYCPDIYFITQVITAQAKADQIKESVHRGVSNCKQPPCYNTRDQKFDQNIYSDLLKTFFICVTMYVSCYSYV